MENLIVLRDIAVDFDGERVLNSINLEIRDKEFITLLGPSGCGKTTTLRIIGGFVEATAGDIFFDGVRINDLPPYKRQVNTVFQRYALFPHLNVFENVEFGLKIKRVPESEGSANLIKIPEAERRAMVKEMLELVGLKGFERRNINQLSGGQQQRVAIARALVCHPRVLLLDEPLGALDLKLRKEMQIELKRIQQSTGITFVYVTHDQGEALALSHRIAVMNQGRVEQLDAPETIYSFPRSRFVADFIGQCNLLDATVEAVDGERVRIDLRGLGEVQALKSFDAQPGEACVLTLRPEKIRLAQSVTADSNEVHFRGRVAELLYLGDVTLYIVELENGERLETLLPNATPGRTKFFEVGDAVEAAWRFDAGHLVRA